MSKLLGGASNEEKTTPVGAVAAGPTKIGRDFHPCHRASRTSEG
jgi:hypothetical protein